MKLAPTKFTLGGDPTLRFSGDGMYCFANVNLAENVSYKAKDGTWSKRTNWIPLVICSRVKDDGKQNRAQWFASSCAKGDTILASGEIQTHAWESKAQDGSMVKHSRLELRIFGDGGDVSLLKRSARNQDADDSVDVPPVDAFSDAPEIPF